ncbi:MULTISPECIES: hypothetical protein [Proteiniphilum]|uniref:hypothetical protein n=1 Tax=Proteiniphilum TaxID=294702 RepID=UPI001EE9D614|nr:MULTISPECIES: hypothetical protein [Proteiniphilum]MDD2246048.1 hypothetical protein [Proteiniphilum sp.]MDD3909596.1 hypothetical protein [Proteiniphilum sp.]MDD4415907.1 hypothetical protein [Proteiniphilum sp.]ULB34101.1 hypothetical protein KDN43_14170 [Proteiniphilum propionicum]
MEKKYKADNGLGNIFWGIMTLILLGILIYKFTHRESIWLVSLYFAFSIVFILSVTIKEYAITHQNFLEIRFLLKLFSKKRRIAIGDIVGMKKLKKNLLRIDKVRGFEVLRVNESDIDSLIAELKERNPRIRILEESEL